MTGKRKHCVNRCRPSKPRVKVSRAVQRLSLKELTKSQLRRVNSALDAAARYSEGTNNKCVGQDPEKCPSSGKGSIVWDRHKRKRLATAMKLLDFVEGNNPSTDSDSSDWDSPSTMRQLSALSELLPPDYFGLCDNCRNRCQKCRRQPSHTCPKDASKK